MRVCLLVVLELGMFVSESSGKGSTEQKAGSAL